MNPNVLWALQWHRFLAPLLYGFTPRFLSGFRTREEQAALFNGKVSTPNPVRFPGTSQHEFGFAYDLAPAVSPGNSAYNAQLDQLKTLGLALGMRWGGPGDPQHFQAFPGRVWDSIFGAVRPRALVL